MNLRKLIKLTVARYFLCAQPVAGNMSEPVRSLLVICFNAIGDFVLSLPALDALQKRYPDAMIELLCSPRNIELARALVGISACHSLKLNDYLWDLDSLR
ncbi:MAG: glycosyltransferase family 9 protein, partial [Aeromonas sp.]